VTDVGDVAHARMAPGRVCLLPGSQKLEDLQGELLLKHSKKDLDADAIAVQVRGRMKRLMKHFGMDFDLVVLDCPPGLSFAALAALDLADRVVVPFRPDFVSQFALDRVAMLIERVETAEQLAGIAFPERRYACLANYLDGSGHQRLLIDQLALDHPLLNVRIPILPSVARAFDWEESKQSMEAKYADAIPYLRALHDEVLGTSQLRAKSA
jgi:cellulose biosynthesis protein BcsQ